MRPRLLLTIAVITLTSAATPAARAQPGPPLHYFHSANLPPGTVAQGQLMHLPALRGYFQPVRLEAPEGARISVMVNGAFDPPRPAPRLVGLLVGQVYQFKVTGIPFQEGFEVYPSIEVLNRLYPPAGQELRFPVPVQFTQQELSFALDGRFVTRVIYLENPSTALPRRQDPQLQHHFEAPPQQDPLRIADRLGRPMMIMRMGSRVPDLAMGEGTGALSPPIQLYPQSPATPAAANASVRAATRPVRRVPRLPERAAGSALRR